MDHPQSNWRAMFERGRHEPPPSTQSSNRQGKVQEQPLAYDDGHDPLHRGAAPMTTDTVTDAAAMALAEADRAYRPWVLQRGTRPVMMLHLRRLDQRSGLWKGWAMGYHQLCSVEYVGSELVALDYGARQFMLEGHHLTELVDHLQDGVVTRIQEFASSVWPGSPPTPAILRIRLIGQQTEGG